MARKATKKAAPKKKAAAKKTTKKPAKKKAATKKPAKKKATAKKKAAPKKKAAAKKPAKKAAPKKKTAAKKPAKKVAAPAAPKKIRKAPKPKNGTTLSYTQSEFVNSVQAFCGIEKKAQAKELCDDLNCLLTDALKKGYKVPLLGLGKLYVRKSKARIGRNPATGEVIQIPARKRVRFSVAKSLKDAVL